MLNLGLGYKHFKKKRLHLEARGQSQSWPKRGPFFT